MSPELVVYFVGVLGVWFTQGWEGFRENTIPTRSAVLFAFLWPAMLLGRLTSLLGVLARFFYALVRGLER